MRLLFDAIPLIVGYYFFHAIWFKEKKMRKEGIPLHERLENVKMINDRISVIPLTGLLGTVVGLIQTLYYMADNYSNLNQVMGGVFERFAPALESTLIAIVTAAVLVFVSTRKIKALGGYKDENNN